MNLALELHAWWMATLKGFHSRSHNRTLFRERQLAKQRLSRAEMQRRQAMLRSMDLMVHSREQDAAAARKIGDHFEAERREAEATGWRGAFLAFDVWFCQPYPYLWDEILLTGEDEPEWDLIVETEVQP